MKCKQCGFKNGKDKNFCTNCGAALKKEKTELSKKQIITIAVSGAAVFAVICAAVFLPRKKGAKSADVTENPAVSESSFDEIRPEKTTEESEVREASSEVGVQNSSSEAGVQKPSSEAPKTDTVSDAPSSVPAAVSEQLKITDGYFYDYSLQDVFADEWRFYADGTCTVKMRPQEGLREYEPEYCTYTMSGNTILINRDGKTVKWEFSPADKCCYCYFSGYSPADAAESYRVIVFHSDNSLSQSEIDNGIKEYSGERKHITKVS